MRPHDMCVAEWLARHEAYIEKMRQALALVGAPIDELREMELVFAYTDEVAFDAVREVIG